MKSLVDHLGQYAAYHRDPRNIARHFIGIPLIVVAVAALLSRPEWPLAGFWLSPALIFCGVVPHLSREKTTAGRLGQIAIGLGLITLALQLIVESTQPLVEAPLVRALLVSLPNDLTLELIVGAVLAIVSYSSLAVVLLVGTLAQEGLVPVATALGLVLGANLGRALVAVLSVSRSDIVTRRLPMGSLLLRSLACATVAPFMGLFHV